MTTHKEEAAIAEGATASIRTVRQWVLEEALRESEEQLRATFDQAAVGMCHVDLKGRWIRVNDKLCEIVGHSRDELVQSTFQDITHPDDIESHLVRHRRLLAGDIPTFSLEKRYVRKDGSLVWANVTMSLARDPRGRALYLIGVVEDISERKRAQEGRKAAEDQLRRVNETLEERVRERTRQLEAEIEERKRAEAALRASEARYIAFFENTTAGILLMSVEDDGSFRYETINPALEQATGRTAAEYTGTSAFDLYPPDLAQRLVGHYRRCVETGEAVTYEETLPFPVGMRTHQVTLVPVRAPDGRISKLLASVHDITERKRVEEVMRQGQKMEAIGQLTGGVAHDFNNLLTAVLGNLELLNQRVEAPNRRLVKSAIRAAERGARLTQQLLAFARKQRLEPEAVDLNRLITGMGDMLKSSIGPKVQIEIVPSEEGWPAMVDVNQLELVLLNLAINARDAMPSGGTLTIRAETLRAPPGRLPAELSSGDYVIIAVADTGCGMTEQVRARAFEPFFTTKEVGKGSGLGLSQVYGILRQLGGGVELDSEPGRGTVVRLYLPRAQEPASAAAPVPERRAGIAAAAPARILVVDDDRDVRELVVSSLASLGYEVIESADGPEALKELAKPQPFDLLLVDFAMPEMDGAELVQRAKRERPDLKAMFMTGFADTAAIDFGRDGAFVLRKPFKLGDLAERVRSVLAPEAAAAAGLRA